MEKNDLKAWYKQTNVCDWVAFTFTSEGSRAQFLMTELVERNQEKTGFEWATYRAPHYKWKPYAVLLWSKLSARSKKKAKLER